VIYKSLTHSAFLDFNINFQLPLIGGVVYVVVSGVGLINEVNRHWAQLVLGWVTGCERVNFLGM